MADEIKHLRKKIDKTDDRILESLAMRRKLVLEIAKLKKLHKIQILDKKREQDLRKRLASSAKKLGLSVPFVSSLYDLILKNSRGEQKK
jgi:chorismate mutase